MRGELNFDESFTRRVALLKGLRAERVYSLFETIPLAEGAERLIRTLRVLGYRTAILSGGFTFFAHELQLRSVITAGSDPRAAKPLPNRGMLRGMSTRRRSYSSAVQSVAVRH